ncbi:MAG TPA: hypothetical protein VLG46_01325 [Anaerolineae bacterium]|nr:hypothetical protein [Anaerolineae bacterium]
MKGPTVGDNVRVVRTPQDLSSMPAETQKAFETIVDHIFPVESIDRYGHLELMVGSVVDPLIGGFMNTVWIEPDCVGVVNQ